MKGVLKDIKEILNHPLIIAALTPLAATIGSKIATGSWLIWFEFLPLWVWFSIAVPIACLILIFKRDKGTKLCGVAVPRYGWEEYTRIDYDGVRWVILRDGRGPDAKRVFPRNNPRPSQIRIEIPPRCPNQNCDTGLRETEHSWGGFTWNCINCEFKKRSKASFCEASKDVELLARRRVAEDGGFNLGG